MLEPTGAVRAAVARALLLVMSVLPLGAMALAIILYFSFEAKERETFIIVVLIAAPPGLVVLLVRLIRPRPHGPATLDCPVCSARRPTSPVRYLQATGFIVVAFLKEWHTFACRRCSARAFARISLVSLLGLGSVTSALLLPGFLLNNLLFLLRSQLMVSTRRFSRRLLLAEQE